MDSLLLIEIEHKIIYKRIFELGELAVSHGNASEDLYSRLEEVLFLRDQVRKLSEEKFKKEHP